MMSTTSTGPQRRRLCRRAGSVLVAAGLAAGLVAEQAHAACSLIPNLQGSFRAVSGLVNRPFATPGDIVEIAVRPSVCDEDSAGLRSQRVADYVASVVFTPPREPHARANVVVVASGCAALADELRACAARPGIAQATCLEARPPGMLHNMALVSRNGERRLGIRLPDTDALVGDTNDRRTLAGPATIAVTTRGAPLPCALADARCADVGAVPGLVACVDELFEGDGSCRTTAASRHTTFGHFTALPPMNDYRSIMASAGVPAADEIRLAVDRAGNVLVPIDWRAAMVSEAGRGDRKLRGVRTLAALLERAGPIVLPNDAFVTSYTTTGDPLPAMFEPGTPAHEPSLFGTLDLSFSVVRLARRSPTLHVCAGGPASGQPCTDARECPEGACGRARCTGGPRAGRLCDGDEACPASECGRGLFEFRDRFFSGVGPVVIEGRMPSPAPALCYPLR